MSFHPLMIYCAVWGWNLDVKSWCLGDRHGETFRSGLLHIVGECPHLAAQEWIMSLRLGCGANCILAFSIFCVTSGATNRINKRLIALKGNSSGFNRILITAYRCLLVTLNYHAFLLFASFLCFLGCVGIKRLVFCTAESQPLFLIHLITFCIYFFLLQNLVL